MRTLRNRPTVWRHERFWRRSPLEGHGYSLQIVLFWGEQVSIFLAAYVRGSGWNSGKSRKSWTNFFGRGAFMDSVERCFAAVTAIGFFVTVVGVILLQTI